MGDDTELTLNVNLRTEKARLEASAFREHQKKIDRELLTEAEIAERAKAEAIKKTNKERIAAATEALKAEQSTYAMMLKSQAVMRLAEGAWNALKDGAMAYGEAMQKSLEKQRQYQDAFKQHRDDLGELAQIMGRKQDDSFTSDMYKYYASVGFRPDEGRQFLEQLYNSGAQFKGSRISDQGFEDYQKYAGQITVARHLDPDTIGDVAGSVLGFHDYSKDPQGAKKAASELNASLAILGRGKGRTSILARQFGMLSSATLNEDAMQGVFNDSREVASVISVGAEKSDAESATMAKAAIRGLRDFEGDPKELLGKAGVDPRTPFIQALKKLTPIIQKEAKDSGMKVQDVVSKYFKDHLTSDAISVYINKGVLGGAFDERAKFAEREASGWDKTDAMIKEAYGSTYGASRMADARLEQAKATRGEKTSKLDIVRRQAVTELLDAGEMDTTDANFRDYLYNWTPQGFGKLSTGSQRAIDQRSRDILNRRTPQEAIDEAQRRGTGKWRGTDEGVQNALVRQIEAIEKFGGNWREDPDHPLNRLAKHEDIKAAARQSPPLDGGRKTTPNRLQ